jgi:type I restriction enzyme M protein
MQPDLAELEARLWDAADELRANSGLKASEYGTPVLGLIFLRFADAKFGATRERIESKGSARRKIGPSDYLAERVIYLTDAARFDYLLGLPEGSGSRTTLMSMWQDYARWRLCPRSRRKDGA